MYSEPKLILCYQGKLQTGLYKIQIFRNMALYSKFSTSFTKDSFQGVSLVVHAVRLQVSMASHELIKKRVIKKVMKA